MTIWELSHDRIADFAVLVDAEASDLAAADIFETNGQAKRWLSPPKVRPFLEKRRKKPLPRADFSYLLPGAIVLNARARAAVGDFLQPFGQLLEVDCSGEREWFFNVTNLIACVDVERSEKTASGRTVLREAFLPGVVPDTPQVFKDPHTARVRIYANDAAKRLFEEAIAREGLTGLSFVAR